MEVIQLLSWTVLTAPWHMRAVWPDSPHQDTALPARADFRPAYLALKSLRQDFPGVPITAVTATATQKVVEDITRVLELRDPVIVRAPSFNR